MNILKKLSILIFICAFLINIFTPSFTLASKLSDDVSGFEANIDSNVARRTKSLKKVVNKLLGFLRIVSAFILVLVLGTSGYKYIVATPEIKGELKKKMLPVILGIILIFSAVTIAGFILEAMGG